MRAVIKGTIIILLILGLGILTYQKLTLYALPTLKTKGSCLDCHSPLKKELAKPFLHAPFKNGECVKCHNPHVSSEGGLLKERANTLCLSCHSKLKERFKKEHLHGALAQGTCLDCHSPHGSNFKGLLKAEEKSLCLKCHKETLEKDLGKKVIHQPFKEGKCYSCHDIHSSPERNLLKGEAKVECVKCHKPGCKFGNINLSEITKDRNCLECHNGHASNSTSLLGPLGHEFFLSKDCNLCHAEAKELKDFKKKMGTELCLGCHPKKEGFINENDPHFSFKENACLLCHSPHGSKREKFLASPPLDCWNCHNNIIKKTEIMNKKLHGLKKSVLRNFECLACHTPVHSQGKYLFRGGDPLGLKTCARCHPREHETTHPVGEKYKDPRTGKALTCSSCHSMHEARYKYLLTHDGERELCLQCHKLP